MGIEFYHSLYLLNLFLNFNFVLLFLKREKKWAKLAIQTSVKKNPMSNIYSTFSTLIGFLTKWLILFVFFHWFGVMTDIVWCHFTLINVTPVAFSNIKEEWKKEIKIYYKNRLNSLHFFNSYCVAVEFYRLLEFFVAVSIFPVHVFVCAFFFLFVFCFRSLFIRLSWNKIQNTFIAHKMKIALNFRACVSLTAIPIWICN